MRYPIIGLAGKVQTGKTTAANYLSFFHQYSILYFATPLKKASAALVDVEEKYFHEQHLKHAKIPGLDITPRYLMQTLGTDCIREHFGYDFFIKLMKKSMAETPLPIVIGDVRFKEEASLINSHGGLLIELTRDTGLDDDHLSEQIDFECDVCISNNGTLEELKGAIEFIVSGGERFGEKTNKHIRS